MWDDQPYYFNMRVTPFMVDFNVRALPGRFDDDGDPVRRAVENPAAWVAEEFRKMLIARGVTIATGDQESAVGQQRTIIYDGVPLSDALKHFNHVSENAVGEVLLHEIAIAHGKSRPGWADGAERISDWLHNEAGLQRGSFRLGRWLRAVTLQPHQRRLVGKAAGLHAWASALRDVLQRASGLPGGDEHPGRASVRPRQAWGNERCLNDLRIPANTWQ